jgi:hypothetical protein
MGDELPAMGGRRWAVGDNSDGVAVIVSEAKDLLSRPVTRKGE